MSLRSSHAALLGCFRPFERAFRRALENPGAAQHRALALALVQARGTRRAERIHGFSKVRTPREFQDAVPICGADGLGAGERNLLTREKPLWLEPSGGSSGPSKLIPMTPALLRQFHRGVCAWLADLMIQRPAIGDGRMYWSISPLGRPTSPKGEAGVVPIGSGSDAAYFPSAAVRLLAELLAVPAEVAQASDIETCRHLTARWLLAAEDLSMISVWNPSFLTLLAEFIDRNAERLIADLGSASRISAERGNQLAKAYRQTSAPPLRELWPKLSLVSLWTEGHAQRAATALAPRLEGIEIQGKGLLATEGVVTIPLLDSPAPLLAVRSHFFEFLPVAQEGRPLLADELSDGATYEVLITTAGGLLRYRVGDLVRVEGHHLSTPMLRFVGRADSVCDLVGEKISAPFAHQALAKGLRGLPPARFAMIAPEWTSPPGYCLFIESSASDQAIDELAQSVERDWMESASYRYARQLGQLRPVRAVRVEKAEALYERRCVQLGQRAGDIKPVDLHREAGWERHFSLSPKA